MPTGGVILTAAAPTRNAPALADATAARRAKIRNLSVLSAAQPSPKRSAPVLGRSDSGIVDGLGWCSSPPTVPRCCARGRVHSGAIGRILAAGEQIGGS